MEEKTRGKIEELLTELGKKIDELIVEAKDVKDDLRDEIEKKIKDLKDKKEDLEKEINDYKNQEKWQEAKEHFFTALHELKKAAESIFSKKD
jgi:uncharacterized coiled-coil DUF342 family protein